MKRLYGIVGLLFISVTVTWAQRQQLSISPLGIVYPKYQLVQYERYLGSLNSIIVLASHNSSKRVFSPMAPARTDRIGVTKLGIGYRRYIDLQNGKIDIFGSVRILGDYAVIQLMKDPKFSIPNDSLRTGGFSITPDISLGGKIYLNKRVTLTGAIGYQHIFKLFSAQNVTRNFAYWNNHYWTNDNQTWEYKRNSVIDFRRGWYPSVQAMIDIWLGKSAAK